MSSIPIPFQYQFHSVHILPVPFMFHIAFDISSNSNILHSFISVHFVLECVYSVVVGECDYVESGGSSSFCLFLLSVGNVSCAVF